MLRVIDSKLVFVSHLMRTMEIANQAVCLGTDMKKLERYGTGLLDPSVSHAG
jgi:hypothetical protein